MSVTRAIKTAWALWLVNLATAETRDTYAEETPVPTPNSMHSRIHGLTEPRTAPLMVAARMMSEVQSQAVAAVAGMEEALRALVTLAAELVKDLPT